MAARAREVLKRLGARYERIEGRERPGSYGDVVSEFRALDVDAAIADLSSVSHLGVSGDDRAVFLSRLLSNDVEGLAEGRSAEALLLTPKGMLISPLVVHCHRDRYMIVTPAATRDTVMGKLGMYVLSASVEVEDLRDQYGRIGVYGPSAGAVIEGLGVPAASIVENGVVPAAISGAKVLVTCARDLGVPGFDLHYPPESAAGVIHAAVEAGAAPAGWHAAEAVRILAGESRFGAEIAEGMLPPEIPTLAERAISYTKGCYVGQETISRLKNVGRVNRELRGLTLGGERVPEPGAPVMLNGKKVGVVTSACMPPNRDTPIALGFVHRKHFDEGTKVEVEMQGGPALATVVAAGGPWDVRQG